MFFSPVIKPLSFVLVCALEQNFALLPTPLMGGTKWLATSLFLFAQLDSDKTLAG